MASQPGRHAASLERGDRYVVADLPPPRTACAAWQPAAAGRRHAHVFGGTRGERAAAAAQASRPVGRHPQLWQGTTQAARPVAVRARRVSGCWPRSARRYPHTYCGPLPTGATHCQKRWRGGCTPAHTRFPPLGQWAARIGSTIPFQVQLVKDITPRVSSLSESVFRLSLPGKICFFEAVVVVPCDVMRSASRGTDVGRRAHQRRSPRRERAGGRSTVLASRCCRHARGGPPPSLPPPSLPPPPPPLPSRLLTLTATCLAAATA